MRFTPMTRREVALEAVPEIRAELEARGRLCLGFAAGAAPDAAPDAGAGALSATGGSTGGVSSG